MFDGGDGALKSNQVSDIQRWLQAGVMHEKGPTAWLAENGEDADEWIDAGSGLNAVSRLGIYSRAYRARLMESLHQQFPVLLKLMETDVFGCFAEDFIRACPPRGHSLLQLGGRFTEWLEETRPKDEPWANLIANLARLERLREEVYHGPGHEHFWVPCDLFDFGIRRLGSLRITPSFRMMECQFPIDTYYLELSTGKTPDHTGDEPIQLGIFRHQWRVQMQRVTSVEREWLSRLSDDSPKDCMEGSPVPTLLHWLDLGLVIPKCP